MRVMKTLMCAAMLVGVSIGSIGSIARADCRDATDRELLNELDRRLRGDGPSDEVGFASFTCSSSTLNIHLITSEAREYAASQDVGFISYCNDYARLFNARVAEVSTLKVLAVCENSVLHKFGVTGETLNVLQPEDLGFISACRDEATRINGRL